MTVSINSPYPYSDKKPSLYLNNTAHITATSDNLTGYGRYISDTASPPPIIQVPYRDPDPRAYREADPGTGINQAVIEGDFTSQYIATQKAICATNLAVKSKNHENADYTIGWQEESSHYFRIVEFNNHKDAGQQFILKKGSGSLFLLGTTPFGTCPNTLKPQRVHADHIDPITDLQVFYVPSGGGFEVLPSVYHQPLYPVSMREEVIALSIQGSIHNCTTCHFVHEMGFDVQMALDKPQQEPSRAALLQTLLTNYALIVYAGHPNYRPQQQQQFAGPLYEIIRSKAASIDIEPNAVAEQMDSITFNDIQNSLQSAQTAKQRYLAMIIEKRLEWLKKSGRFIYHSDNAYLYDTDGLALGWLLKLTDLVLPVAIQSKLSSLTASFEFGLTPYQRVTSQCEKSLIYS